MKKLLSLALVGFFFTPAAFAENCLRTRGILDIGSGSTKAKVAVVDVCVQKIDHVVMEEKSEKIGYEAEFKRLGEFSEKIQDDGLRALRRLIQAGNASAQGPVEWRGFATSAFRTALNGGIALKKFSDALNIPLTLITQELEGRWGYLAGIQMSERGNPDRTVVWDIGGGSQQFVFRFGRKLEVIKLVDKASEGFKRAMIRDVKKITDSSVETPNRIGYGNLAAGEAIAEKWAAAIQFPFQPLEVIGIGGVHSKAIPKVTKTKTRYEIPDLDNVLPRLLSLTDQELSDPYASTLVSNVILVKGFMKRLNIKRVKISPYGVADGALVDPGFWE